MNATTVEQTLGELFLGLDHIALAVPDLDASVALYRDVLGFAVINELETRGEHTGMQSAVMRLGGVTIVLVQGTEPDSQVSRFVERFGPGVQHIAIEVSDLAAASELLRARGLCYETPVIESPHTLQRFTTRAPAMGVRIELIERRGAGFDERSVREIFVHMELNGAI